MEPTELTSTNPAIEFTKSGLEVGNDLPANTEKVLTIQVKYLDVTELKSTENTTFTISLQFSQAGTTGGGTVEPTPTTKTVYSKRMLTSVEISYDRKIRPGDSLEKITGYTENYNTLTTGGNLFLKHIIKDEIVESSEVCFIKGSLYCLVSSTENAIYEANKNLLKTAFGEASCTDHSNYFTCYDGSLGAEAHANSEMISAWTSYVACQMEGEGAYCSK